MNLKRHSRSQPIGRVLDSEASYHCFGDDGENVRKPDVSLIRFGRLPGQSLPTGSLQIPPDLAVEVVSPNDRVYELQAKIAEYLAGGVRLIWVINPDDRTVTVYSQESDQPVLIRESGTLTGGAVLPGFACPVASLFPPDSEPLSDVSAG